MMILRFFLFQYFKSKSYSELNEECAASKKTLPQCDQTCIRYIGCWSFNESNLMILDRFCYSNLILVLIIIIIGCWIQVNYCMYRYVCMYVCMYSVYVMYSTVQYVFIFDIEYYTCTYILILQYTVYGYNHVIIYQVSYYCMNRKGIQITSTSRVH